MKRLLLVCFTIALTNFGVAQEKVTELNWLTNLEKAQKFAKKQNKPILLYFTGSDWCSPCKMLKEDFFNSEEFTAMASDIILVMIDRPRRVDIISEKQMEYNKGVIAKYNKRKSFPYILMLNSKGKELGNISGYSSLRDTSNHFTFINKHLAKSK